MFSPREDTERAENISMISKTLNKTFIIFLCVSISCGTTNISRPNYDRIYQELICQSLDQFRLHTSDDSYIQIKKTLFPLSDKAWLRYHYAKNEVLGELDSTRITIKLSYVLCNNLNTKIQLVDTFLYQLDTIKPKAIQSPNLNTPIIQPNRDSLAGGFMFDYRLSKNCKGNFSFSRPWRLKDNVIVIESAYDCGTLCGSGHLNYFKLDSLGNYIFMEREELYVD